MTNPFLDVAALRGELRNLGYTVDLAPHGVGVRAILTRPGNDRPFVGAFGRTALEALRRAAALAADPAPRQEGRPC